MIKAGFRVRGVLMNGVPQTCSVCPFYGVSAGGKTECILANVELEPFYATIDRADWCILKESKRAKRITENEFITGDVDDNGYLPVWVEYRTDHKSDGWTTISVEDLESEDENMRYWTRRPSSVVSRSTAWGVWHAHDQ